MVRLAARLLRVTRGLKTRVMLPQKNGLSSRAGQGYSGHSLDERDQDALRCIVIFHAVQSPTLDLLRGRR